MTNFKQRKIHKPQVGQIIDFKIEHIDPLGQGVYKNGKDVVFIHGTLPSETGKAEVYKKSKGVKFARLIALDTISDNRVEPVCPHFNVCPGCQFLHTDYKTELGFKRLVLLNSLQKIAPSKYKKFNIDEDLVVSAAPHRLAYRNRVQLHYRHRYIGMLDGASDQVVKVPDCKIIDPQLQDAFTSLYETEDWAVDHTGRGHCELYAHAKEVKVSWDRSYAEGGFTQVYGEMNECLKDSVQQQLHKNGDGLLLDLFSGAGNLSDRYVAQGGTRLLVDAFESTQMADAEFYQLNLFEDDALKRFSRKYGKRKFTTILVDPPRAGFSNINQWLKRIKPSRLVYVSCNPASLARDLGTIEKKFLLEYVELLDLFPATAHFETMVSIRFNWSV